MKNNEGCGLLLMIICFTYTLVSLLNAAADKNKHKEGLNWLLSNILLAIVLTLTGLGIYFTFYE